MNLKDTVANSVGNVRATISKRAVQAADMAGDMELINKQALKDLSPEEVFIFEFELSNSNVDYYNTRMTQDTLENYAGKINSQGVPLMASHIDETYPAGRIYFGQVNRTDDGVFRLLCRAYIVRDDNNGDVSASTIIRKIETGVQKDTSIGFLAGGYTCSICGQPMVDGWYGRAMGVDCDHVPGVMYEGKMCYAWVEDGTILEGSLVYVGATPEAIIQKAVNGFKSGLISPKLVNSVNKALNSNIKLENKEGEKNMKAKELLGKLGERSTLSEGFRTKLSTRAAEVSEEAEAEQAVVVLGEEVEELEKENNALRSQAAVGKEYKDSLIQSTLAEGVRAMGQEFDASTIQKYLENATIKEIEGMKSQYGKIVNALTDDVNKGKADPTEVKDEEKPEVEERVAVEDYK